MRGYSLGAIYAIGSGANPTPVWIGSLKGAKVGIKQAKKSFRGNQRDIIDVGDGARDWSIEIESVDFKAEALKLVVPGGGATAIGAARNVAITESGTVPATPFQITVAQSATWVENALVFDATANKVLTVGATASATGIYAYAAGVYTFNTADQGHVMYITYAYSSATLGRTTTFSNAIQSQSTPFKVRVYDVYRPTGSSSDRLVGLDFYSVHFEELSLDFKVEDFSAVGLKGFASQDMIGTTLKVCDVYDSEVGGL